MQSLGKVKSIQKDFITDKPVVTVMLDDVSASLKGAKQAGMMTIGIIEAMSCQSMEEMKQYSDKLIETLSEDIFD